MKTSILFLLICGFVISGIVELPPINTELPENSESYSITESYPNTREDGLLYSSLETGGYDGATYDRILIFKDGRVIIAENKTITKGICNISQIENLQKEIEKLGFEPQFEKKGMMFDGFYGNSVIYNGKYPNGIVISYSSGECKELSKESEKLNKKYNNILENIERLSNTVIKNIENKETSTISEEEEHYLNYILSVNSEELMGTP